LENIVAYRGYRTLPAAEGKSKLSMGKLTFSDGEGRKYAFWPILIPLQSETEKYWIDEKTAEGTWCTMQAVFRTHIRFFVGFFCGSGSSPKYQYGSGYMVPIEYASRPFYTKFWRIRIRIFLLFPLFYGTGGDYMPLPCKKHGKIHKFVKNEDPGFNGKRIRIQESSFFAVPYESGTETLNIGRLKI
jgi:hypothetical protein